MKRFLCWIILIFSLNFSNSQMHEFGLFVGGSNFIGDIGGTEFIKPSSTSIGLLYKWNITTRYSLRTSFKSSRLEGSDTKSKDINRFSRGLSFKNNIQEFSAGIEFNFFDFNLHDEQMYYSPYIYTGINYFKYSLLKMNFSSKIAEKYDEELNFALPIILGLKTNISSDFVIGIEFGFRYTFTDNIDSSNPIKEFSDNKDLKFGELSNKDWYTFSGITFSYTFGRMPCYCKEK